MPPVSLKCTHCRKKFLRPSGHANETARLGRRPYCSIKCVSLKCTKRITVKCANLDCKKDLSRTPSQISPHNYCSRRCAAIISNRIFPRNMGITKICATCGINFKSREKYCSTKCQYKGYEMPTERIITWIKNFHQTNGRIPLKREYIHAKAARNRFETWNNAIKAAGFKPNPVMFASKHMAKDGHMCDSLAERIIDDWLSKNGLPHKRNIKYPGGERFTVDFKVNNLWVEFFGLSGEHKKYDQLKRRKLKLAQEYKLKVIEIYPKDLFPKNNLEKILNITPQSKVPRHLLTL